MKQRQRETIARDSDGSRIAGSVRQLDLVCATAYLRRSVSRSFITAQPSRFISSNRERRAVCASRARVRGRRLPGEDPARFSPHGCTQSRPGGCPRHDRDAAHRSQTRSIFDRCDVTSEQDLAEGARKLQILATGPISGTVGDPEAGIVVKMRKNASVIGGPPGDRTRDTLIKSSRRRSK
jgi:hypothetical protein